MSGIAGIFDTTHQITNQITIFEKMMQSMKHRGSFNSIYVDNHISLMQISNEQQVMSFQQYYIIFDGKCFNMNEIKELLLEKELSFQHDLEAIIKLYILYKENCLNYMNGHFSFVIYDKEEQSLFLVRDHLGVKPLFYTFIDKILLFASEIKTLLTYPLVQPIIDQHSIHELAYLGPGRIEGTTLFKNIFELKPGEYATYKNNHFIKTQYYECKSKLHIDNYNETILNVRNLVIDSIESQLKDLDDFGCFLSGGLDSSIIVAVASNYLKKQNKRLKTYSLEFKDNYTNFKPNSYQPTLDSSYIQLMIDQFNLNHKVVTLNNHDLINSLYKSLEARDLPGMGDIDSSLYCFCKNVKKEVDVVFSGECSDEIFGGYPWFKENIHTFPWNKNIELRNSLLNNQYQIDYKNYIEPLYNQTLINTHVNEYDFDHDIQYKQMIQLNMHWFMQTLIDRNDRMSSAFNLDVRVPFCNPSIFDYVYNIPKSFKTVNSIEKGLLREAFKDLLPIEIIERTKSPFPKTYDPNYLEILRNELYKLNNNEPLWIIFNRNKVLEYFKTNNNEPWYGQLMTTPQTIAYFLQINYWLKKYKIQIQ